MTTEIAPRTQVVTVSELDASHHRRRPSAPVLALLLLSPFVAEALLGDVALTSLPVLLFLVPLYGCGALVIREVARRTGRGWPTIVVLALAYGVVEEGLLTQSLFNPDYAGQHLLVQGHLPVLGIGLKWTVHVLLLHVVWSICTPIALVECATAGERARRPWLAREGLVKAGIVLVIGGLATVATSLADTSFRPSPEQLAGAAAVATLLVAVALLMPRPGTTREAGPVPAPWVVAVGSLAAASAVMRASELSVVPALALYLGVGSLAVLLVTVLGRRSGWTAWHVYALTVGAVFAYAWDSFFVEPIVGSASPAVDHVGDLVFSLAAFGVLFVVYHRLRAKMAG